MKIVSLHRLRFVFLLVFSLLLSVSYAQEGDAANGKKLFKANCAACHKLDKKMTGPALRGITERRDSEWLHKWIVNNVDLRASGDADAIAIYDEYKGSPMNVFPQLSKQDVDDILAYTSEPIAAPVAEEGTAANQPNGDGGEASSGSNTLMLVVLGALGLLLLALIAVLARLSKTLKETKSNEEKSEEKTPINWKEVVAKNTPFLVMGSIIAFVIVMYLFFSTLMKVGVEQEYQPIQPIYFSHKIHAGDNEIDCKYCHSSARVSKHSGIPSVNVCMNCHTYIQDYNGDLYGKTKDFYDNEIQKIYDAIGYDTNEAKYIEGYKQKPIKWVKVHNLPDFVYFNHSQHHMVGNVDCKECHGEVEEMHEVKQHSELTMGWCVNCHRETNVDVKNNPYYKNIHEQLARKYGVKEVTVDMIGGLECGKCHY